MLQMNGSRKVVIFGGGGQLGVELCREFERRQLDGSAVRPAIARCNRQRTRWNRPLRQRRSELVINSAAYNQVDIAEQEPLAAYQANALAVRNLALACRQSDAQLVHYSTDYVFDGTKAAPYIETDPPHPLGAYAVSKLAGELYAQAYLGNPLIIRTSGVFGPGRHVHAARQFRRTDAAAGQGQQPIRVVEDHFASPTYAPAMASAPPTWSKKGCAACTIWGAAKPISWYDYAKLIFELAGLSPVAPADR